MNSASESKTAKARQFYNATAGDFSLMNYGYAPAAGSSFDASEPERYCLELYRHVVNGGTLENRRVLEVSCGRGGGAAFMSSTCLPAEYVGLDVSEQNLERATRQFADIPGLRFQLGRAESLPFEDGSFDAVINIEASHLYDHPEKFFAEAHRVLRHGGVFFYADLFWSNSDPERLLSQSGLTVTHREDITANVLKALELDTERREQIVTLNFPEQEWENYRNWSGVKGYRAYNRFMSGEWVYRCFTVQRLNG
jgi:SAM-dependent methyltransferase